MDFKQTFFRIDGKISGLSYFIRIFLTAFSLPIVVLAIGSSFDLDAKITLPFWGIILCLWLIQDKKRILK